MLSRLLVLEQTRDPNGLQFNFIEQYSDTEANFANAKCRALQWCQNNPGANTIVVRIVAASTNTVVVEDTK